MIICATFTVPMLCYLGPGGVLTMLGSAVALVGAVAVAFFGLVWYPIKRLLRWWRSLKVARVANHRDAGLPMGRSRR